MIAIDTNVLVYAIDNDAPIKQTKALDLLGRLRQVTPSAILLWQVASEFLSVLRKRQSKGRITSTEVETHFRQYGTMFPLVVPGPRVFATYFDLHTRFSLSHWDSMLLAACKEAGVTTLYSEDMDAGTDYDGLAIVNPFA
jgi:predicted nucleic acid-binding protein